MRKFFKEIWQDYLAAQKEMSEMGMWMSSIPNNVFTYLDPEQYKKYVEKIRNHDNNKQK